MAYFSRKLLIRNFSGGRFRLPLAKGEPLLNYAPGSPERALLENELGLIRSRSAIEIPCVINGKEYFSGDTFDQVMPSDHGHVLARVHKATSAMIAESIEVANAARSEWASMPFEHRATIFRRAADLISGKHRANLCATVMLSTGKTAWQAEIDAAAEAIDFLRLNCGFAEEIYDVQPPINSPNTWNRLEYRELEGFVLAISPFNFCAIGVNLGCAPALMGNTVLWKPASTSVISNYTTYRILQEAGLPAGVMSFLPSSGKIAGQAINNPHFAGLHFTGSTAVFNQLWSQISTNLQSSAGYKSYPRIVGETGGKNFHLIHPSADADHALFNTVRGAFEYQGQKCSATSRLYVPKSLWHDKGFGKKLADVTNSITMGQPDDLKNFMTAVIDKQAFSDHKGYIDRAHVNPECRIIAGGTYDDTKGYFVRPTIIVTTNPKYESMHEEIFGPVLTVYVYDDSVANYWDDILQLVDTTSPYALTGAIFARDRAALMSATQRLRHAMGNLYLNDKSTGAIVGEQPFGGGRASGTNDKAGSHLNLLRWVSARSIKENSGLITGYDYPHMQ